MATVRVCDKCSKVLHEKDENNPDKSSWDSVSPCQINIKQSMILKKQKVAVEVRVFLECGDHLDLCNKCGWEIVKKFTK